MFVEIPGALTPEQTQRCRQALEAAEWQDGRRTAGHMAALAKSNEQLADDHPLTAQLGGLILERLNAIDRFIIAALPLRVLPPRFNRYAAGGAYGDHVDSAVFSLPSGHRLRSDLSATLFLSDPQSYDGGELTIQGPSGPRQAKLPAGHLLLYPADTLHRVAPVTRGVRLAAFFWIQSMVREHERRAMLIELDDSIRLLRQSQSDTSAVGRLTRLYHDLLRHWSVV